MMNATATCAVVVRSHPLGISFSLLARTVKFNMEQSSFFCLGHGNTVLCLSSITNAATKSPSIQSIVLLHTSDVIFRYPEVVVALPFILGFDLLQITSQNPLQTCYQVECGPDLHESCQAYYFQEHQTVKVDVFLQASSQSQWHKLKQQAGHLQEVLTL